MIYKKDDLGRLSWDEFDRYAKKIYDEVKDFLDKNNLLCCIIVIL